MANPAVALAPQLSEAQIAGNREHLSYLSVHRARPRGGTANTHLMSMEYPAATGLLGKGQLPGIGFLPGLLSLASYAQPLRGFSIGILFFFYFKILFIHLFIQLRARGGQRERE